MNKVKYENPFYHNYIFSKKDLNRVKIKQRYYPEIWFKPMYVQLNDGYIFYFKIASNGQIFLLKIEKEN